MSTAKDQIDLAALQADAEQQTQNQAARFNLDDVVAAGNQLEELQQEATFMANVLKAKMETIRVLETETLPDMLKNIGLRELVLTSGAKISLYDVIGASITEENREAAHEWLREHNHGDLIKNNVILTFGKGEDTIAKDLVKHLLQMRKAGETKFGEIDQKEQVHPSTLKAFVKRQVEDGNEFPGPLFKLYTGQAVKIEVEKKKGR